MNVAYLAAGALTPAGTASHGAVGNTILRAVAALTWAGRGTWLR